MNPRLPMAFLLAAGSAPPPPDAGLDPRLPIAVLLMIGTAFYFWRRRANVWKPGMPKPPPPLRRRKTPIPK
jgi:hypothetical protein